MEQSFTANVKNHNVYSLCSLLLFFSQVGLLFTCLNGAPRSSGPQLIEPLESPVFTPLDTTHKWLSLDTFQLECCQSSYFTTENSTNWKRHCVVTTCVGMIPWSSLLLPVAFKFVRYIKVACVSFWAHAKIASRVVSYRTYSSLS